MVGIVDDHVHVIVCNENIFDTTKTGVTDRVIVVEQGLDHFSDSFAII